MDRRWVLLSEKANLKGSHSVRFIYIMFLKWQNCRTAGKYQLLSGLGVVAGNVWCKGQHQVSVMEQFCIFIVAATEIHPRHTAQVTHVRSLKSGEVWTLSGLHSLLAVTRSCSYLLIENRAAAAAPLWQDCLATSYESISKEKNFKQLYITSKTDPPLHKRLYD